MHAWVPRTKYCRSCRAKEAQEIRDRALVCSRIEARDRSVLLVDRFVDRLEDCEKYGTCDILAAHHDALIDDPERLSTEFMLKMVCNTDGLERYRGARAKRDTAVGRVI